MYVIALMMVSSGAFSTSSDSPRTANHTRLIVSWPGQPHILFPAILETFVLINHLTIAKNIFPIRGAGAERESFFLWE